MKETIQEEKKRKKKKAATTTTQSPLKVTSKTGWHKSRGEKKTNNPPQKETKPNKHTFLSARHISDCRWQNNTKRVRGIKIKTPKCVWLFHESVSKRRLHTTSNPVNSPESLPSLPSAACALDYCVQLKGKCWECHTWECVLSTIKYQDPDGSSSLKNTSTPPRLQQHLLPGLGRGATPSRHG